MGDLNGDSLALLAESISPGRIGSVVIVLVATYLGLRALGFVVTRIAERFPSRRLVLNRTLPVVRFFIWVAALFVSVAFVLAPPKEALLALAASGGLALGLAAQDLVKNVISGLLILFEQPFQVGDIIESQTVEGEVVAIGLRATRLRTFGDSIVTIPNGRLFEDVISNANSGELRQQVSVQFQLPAHVDVVAVKNLAIEAAETSPYVWLGGPISVVIEDAFDRTFLTRFSLKAYVVDIRLQRVFASQLLERIRRESLRRRWIDERIVLSALGVAAAPQVEPGRDDPPARG